METVPPSRVVSWGVLKCTNHKIYQSTREKNAPTHSKGTQHPRLLTPPPCALAFLAVHSHPLFYQMGGHSAFFQRHFFAGMPTQGIGMPT